MNQDSADTKSAELSLFEVSVAEERPVSAIRKACVDADKSNSFVKSLRMKLSGHAQLYGTHAITLGPLMTLVLNACARASVKGASEEPRHKGYGTSEEDEGGYGGSQRSVRCYRLCEIQGSGWIVSHP